MLLDLLFEMALQVAQEFQVGLRMEALDAAEVASEKAIQELLLGAVQQEPDVEKLLPLGVGDVTHQVIRASLQAAFIRHGYFQESGDQESECAASLLLNSDFSLLTPSSSHPIGKRIERGILGVDDRLAQCPPPRVEGLDQPRQLAGVRLAPFRGDSLRALLQFTGCKVFDAGKKEAQTIPFR